LLKDYTNKTLLRVRSRDDAEEPGVTHLEPQELHSMKLSFQSGIIITAGMGF